MKECIPEDKKNDCIRSSRIFVILWLTIIIFSFIFNSFLPILLFLFPKFYIYECCLGTDSTYGTKESTKDQRVNKVCQTKSNFSFIYWKMEYHIEHHMFPMVPSYNLPKLHEEIKYQLPKPQSLLEAYKEIIPAVIKKSKNPNYYIPVKIPNF